MGSSFYRTIAVPFDGCTADEIAALFVLAEPFGTWDCAFCGLPGGASSSLSTSIGVSLPAPTLNPSKASRGCACQSVDTTPGAVPSTRDDFAAHVLAEHDEAIKLQRAAVSYLKALNRHSPFGGDFNRDQQFKIERATVQLEQLKERFSDLLLASQHLLASTDKVPLPLLAACEHARALLANCFGNIRECHVCYKLNYTLCRGGSPSDTVYVCDARVS